MITESVDFHLNRIPEIAVANPREYHAARSVFIGELLRRENTIDRKTTLEGIAEKGDTTIKHLCAERDFDHIITLRFLAYHLFHARWGSSYPEIGRIFDKDQSSINAGDKRFEKAEAKYRPIIVPYCDRHDYGVGEFPSEEIQREKGNLDLLDIIAFGQIIRKRPRLHGSRLIQEVGREINLSRKEVQSNNLHNIFVNARRVIAYLLRDHFKWSYPPIGEELHQNHATIIMGYNLVKQTLEKHPKEIVDRINFYQSPEI